MPERCRNWIESKHDRCNEPADCIPWGKLLDREFLGPRCYPCAEAQLGYRNVHDPAWAIYHLPDAGLGVCAAPRTRDNTGAK